MSDIYATIKKAVRECGEVQYNYGELPKIPKVVWTELGDRVTRKEKQIGVTEEGLIENIPSDKSFTMRLDIRAMSNIKKQLQKRGILTSSWDTRLARIMQDTCQLLANEFGAKYAYTQSDEISLVIVPPTKEESPNYQHPFNGRYQKLITTASGIASAKIQDELRQRASRTTDNNAQMFFLSCLFCIMVMLNTCFGTEITYLAFLAFICSLYYRAQSEGELPIVTFDCRLAVWDNARDAFQLILWRSYDCSINGVSDAIYNSSAPKELTKSGTHIKLKWLSKNNLLPLHLHQAYGSLYQRIVVNKESFIRNTGVPVTVQRKVLTQVAFGRNIINYVKYGGIAELLYPHSNVKEWDSPTPQTDSISITRAPEPNSLTKCDN